MDTTGSRGNAPSQNSPRLYRWVPSSGNATVAGREIGGMVYVGIPPDVIRVASSAKCAAVIDPTLPVGQFSTDKKSELFPYKPGYSEISADCRATYLEWLATGRSDPSFDSGCGLLYYYGLERRFFLGNSSGAEKREILEEALRLHDVYSSDSEIQCVIGGLIKFGIFSLFDAGTIKPDFSCDGWVFPLSLSVALGTLVRDGESLSADWMFSWYHCHPVNRLSGDADRTRAEFRALFKLRFDKWFPDGLKIDKPDKLLQFHYMAKSGEFSAYIFPRSGGKPVVDVENLDEPLKIAKRIAGEVTKELDKYYRFVKDKSRGLGSLQVLSLLRKELWPLLASKELEQLGSWARRVAAEGGFVPVAEVVARLTGRNDGQLEMQQLTLAADALARVGFGFAPDPRSAFRYPNIEESVVLFELGETDAPLCEVSDTYRMAFLAAASGALVAHADGIVTESERESLVKNVNDSQNLNGQMRRRLIANIDWMLSNAPDFALLRKKLRGIKANTVQAVRNVMVSVAHSNGAVNPQEVAVFEKIYKVLRLDPADAYSDLHAGSIQGGLFQICAAEPSALGETIRAESPAGGVQLDSERIATIHSDTDQVFSVLGEIFDKKADGLESGRTQHMLISGLDAQYAAFANELVNLEHWTGDGFQELCARHSLMPSGAIEDINEWAFETYGDTLLEEHDGYEVNADIAGALKRVFKRESGDVSNETG